MVNSMNKKPLPPGYWTIDRIRKEKDKYKSVRDWRENNISSYAAASRLKLLPELTKDLYKEIKSYGYWDINQIKDRIQNFKTFKEWYQKDNKSYSAARRLGLLNHKITNHLLKIEGRPVQKWTKINVLNNAKMFNSKGLWKSSFPTAYRAARDRGYFNEAVKHMDLLGNKHFRCLYTIEVLNENKIYVGLTQNFKTRISSHLKSDRFKKYKKNQLKINKETDYLEVNKAAKLEQKLILMKKRKGYLILNRMVGGGIGGQTLIWNKENVLLSAKKYSHKVRWKEMEPGAYASALRNNFLEEATQHMTILNPKGKWSIKENVLANAKKYSSKSSWMKSSSGAYESAKRNEWFKEAVKHMSKPLIKSKWTKSSITKIAKKIKYKKDFHSSFPGAYEAAKKNGWFTEITSHMENKRLLPIKWDKKNVIKDAKIYVKKSEWKKMSPGAVAASKRGNYYDEATSHMQ